MVKGHMYLYDGNGTAFGQGACIKYSGKTVEEEVKEAKDKSHVSSCCSNSHYLLLF